MLCFILLIFIGEDVGFCGFFCQAEDGIRDLVRSRGLGDVYKRQDDACAVKHRPGCEKNADVDAGAVQPLVERVADQVLSLIHI